MGRPGEQISVSEDCVIYAGWAGLTLWAEDNYEAYGGAGAVDLSWEQKDGQSKYYKLYQSLDESNWKGIFAGSTVLEKKEVSEEFDVLRQGEQLVIKENGYYKEVCNVMLGEVNRYLNEFSKKISEVKFTPEDIAKTVQMVKDGKITKNAQKEIIKHLFLEGSSPEEIADMCGFVIKDDINEIEKAVKEIISENKHLVKDYINGNQKVFGFFMGEAVKKVGKNTNPKTVRDTLLTELER